MAQTPTHNPSANPLTIHIQATRGLAAPKLREWWHYRDLLIVLMLRDLRVRYKQTFLGAAWAIIRPVASMIIFTVFFGHWLNVQQSLGDTPYAIFVYAGLLPWGFFGSTVGGVSSSLIANSEIFRKVYVPRIIFPMSAVGVPLVDFLIAMVILFGLMLGYNTPMTPWLLLIPVLLIVTFCVALGVGLIIASLAVWYRDFLQAIGFVMQMWMFLTPVIYPVKVVPPAWQWVLSVNPMFGVIESFRAVVLNEPVQPGLIAVSFTVGLAILCIGWLVFNVTERYFADVV